MFREMRRIQQQLGESICQDILVQEKRAVLSLVGDDGYPYGVPVNYVYDPTNQTAYIHGAKVGHKIDAITQCDKVCFTVWKDAFQKEGDWSWYVNSVIAFGRAELVQDAKVTENRVREMAMKYYPTMEEVEEGMKSLPHVQLIAVHFEHITGKQIHEK